MIDARPDAVPEGFEPQPVLSTLLEARVRVEEAVAGSTPHVRCRLLEEDRRIRVYEGQLKEAVGPEGEPVPDLEPGEIYRLLLKAFVNDRWFQVKVLKVLPD